MWNSMNLSAAILEVKSRYFKVILVSYINNKTEFTRTGLVCPQRSYPFKEKVKLKKKKEGSGGRVDLVHDLWSVGWMKSL